MTVPPLRKWRPCFGLYRDRLFGFQFFIHPHRDYNPIVVVSRWAGAWYIEVGRLIFESGKGWRVAPRYW